MGEAQAPWLSLLNEGSFAATAPRAPGSSFVVGPRWRRRLEGAVAAGRADNWSGWYHLGIMRFFDGDTEAARIAWERSLAAEVTPWALRNLAVLAAGDARLDEAIRYYRKALQHAPALGPLVVEAGQFSIDAGRPEEWLAVVPGLDPSLSKEGRVRLLEAQAALAGGRSDVAASFFAHAPAVVDVREGEMTLEELWYEWQAQEMARAAERPLEEARQRVRRERPVPPAFDFDMFRSPQED
jgi:tetratricopeptide (TPR) repeat protein